MKLTSNTYFTMALEQLTLTCFLKRSCEFNSPANMYLVDCTWTCLMTVSFKQMLCVCVHACLVVCVYVGCVSVGRRSTESVIAKVWAVSILSKNTFAMDHFTSPSLLLFKFSHRPSCNYGLLRENLAIQIFIKRGWKCSEVSFLVGGSKNKQESVTANSMKCRSKVTCGVFY